MVFTQKLTMHLNGGSKFSELHYDILADGKPTNLKRLTRTSGSPKYIKTQYVIWDVSRLEDPSAAFDVIDSRGAGLQECLEANVKVAALPTSAPMEEGEPT